MKFYNDFNSMFNAQSGVKSDMSVFNRIYSTADPSDDVFFFMDTVENPATSDQVDLYYECKIPLDDELTNLTERYHRALEINQYLPDIWISWDNQDLDMLLDGIVHKFAAQCGGMIEYDDKNGGVHLKFSGGLNSDIPKLSKKLAERIDFALCSDKVYDLTNPIKEKFMMSVD